MYNWAGVKKYFDIFKNIFIANENHSHLGRQFYHIKLGYVNKYFNYFFVYLKKWAKYFILPQKIGVGQEK